MTKATEFQTIDERITAFLTERNGRPLGNWDIAKHFGMDSTRCITVIRRLERAGVVRVDRSRTQNTYYIPNAEQLAALDAAQNAVPNVRPFKPYQFPKSMLDVMARIRSEREAINSHYGQAA